MRSQSVEDDPDEKEEDKKQKDRPEGTDSPKVGLFQVAQDQKEMGDCKRDAADERLALISNHSSDRNLA